jgi:hypothetical protein
MKISERQIEAILSLPGEDRFKHFVKVVVDTEEAWGLYQDGWAMAITDNNQPVFPLWPAEEYARLCAVDKWEAYQTRSISLCDILEVLLPNLRKDGTLPGILYSPSGEGVTPSIEKLEDALREEMSRY